jgi:hypothetical protein
VGQVTRHIWLDQTGRSCGSARAATVGDDGADKGMLVGPGPPRPAEV